VKIATILLFIFILQIFNPRQGSILVGIGGAKFFIIPFLWFYFGLFLDEKFIKRMFNVVVLIAVIAALYGMKQIFFGFTQFEKYWIDWGGYSALHLFQTIRCFSTFSSAGEYAHYLTIAGIICFALLLKYKFKALSFVMLTIISVALFIAAVRTAIFAFVFSSIVLIGFFVKDSKKGIVLVLIVLIFAGVFISRVGITPEVDENSAISASVHHTLKGITNPSQEHSFRMRMNIWFVKVPRRFIANPFGYGLGSRTLAAWKFGSPYMATENIVLDLILSTGIAGLIAFLLLFIAILKKVFFLMKIERNSIIGILVITLTITFFLIGSASEYSVFPIIFLLWGVFASKISELQQKSAQMNKQ
jgi:O-antigen ligase